MAKDVETRTPEEKSHPVLFTGTPVLPFDIGEYLPKRQRTRAWFTVGRPETAAYSINGPTISSRLPSARESLGATAWRMLTIAMLLLVVFGIVRFGVWSYQASYPGTEQCYQIELWFHGVKSDFSRIQWAASDAEEEITNRAQAEEANRRIEKMFLDMRTSLARNQAPEEVAQLKALWLQFLDLGVEIGEASPENVNRLRQEQDDVLAQRREEERRVLHNCRLAATGYGPDRGDSGRNRRNIPAARRSAFYEGAV